MCLEIAETCSSICFANSSFAAAPFSSGCSDLNLDLLLWSQFPFP